MGTRWRALGEKDHGVIVGVVDEWWGGRNVARWLPRLYFQHFNDTSLVVEDEGGLVAFLIGFVSQSREGEAYVHFIGIRPDHRGSGMGKALYEAFFEEVKKRGCKRVCCITSPVNKGSIAFHGAMGFRLKQGDREEGGVPIHEDYDGPGEDRVVFEKVLI